MRIGRGSIVAALALLSDLLHPFPDDTLRVHLPHSSSALLPSPHPLAVDSPSHAEATAVDGPAAHATSAVVQPSLTLEFNRREALIENNCNLLNTICG
jgi:hypothetical protein